MCKKASLFYKKIKIIPSTILLYLLIIRSNVMLGNKIIDSVIEISEKAGSAIMSIYATDFDFKIKDDNSPLTEADEKSNEIICKSIKSLTPEIPILSEENADTSFSERSLWNNYWLVDPLDGTKEFINRNDEFTVNIALIRENRPIFGVIHAPALNKTFWGAENFGSHVINQDGINHQIFTKKFNDDYIRVVSSRSHKSEKDLLFLDEIGDYKDHPVGSSLKLCYLATGEADIYPRFGKTSEWDIAAGDAVLSFAGGIVLGNEKKIIKYNMKESLINNSFIAFGCLNKKSENICSKFYDLVA